MQWETLRDAVWGEVTLCGGDLRTIHLYVYFVHVEPIITSGVFVLHPVDHWPCVIVQGHWLPTQNLLGFVQVNLRVLRGRQLGNRVLKRTKNKRRWKRWERKGG